MLLNNPNKVEFSFSSEEIKSAAESYLEKEIGQPVVLEINIDSEYDDLFDISPDEDRNNDEVFNSLQSNGFSPDDITQFKLNLFDRMLGFRSYSLMAYKKGNNDSQFDVLIKVPYEVYEEQLKN